VGNGRGYAERRWTRRRTQLSTAIAPETVIESPRQIWKPCFVMPRLASGTGQSSGGGQYLHGRQHKAEKFTPWKMVPEHMATMTKENLISADAMQWSISTCMRSDVESVALPV
jgi:hypothetical protein